MASKTLLSILIPTIKKRELVYNRLITELIRQIGDLPIEIITSDEEPPTTIGFKRNRLMSLSKAKYVCFFDDDDYPTEHYIPTIFEGIVKDVDCVYLRGVMTTNGKNPEIFEHSIRHNLYKTNHEGEIKYFRFPNHLNAIKRSIASKFKFPESNWGEDTQWATLVFQSGLIKTEYYSDKVLYQYLYNNKK